MEIAAFAPEHLAGVLALCRAEGWPSLPADEARALRALTAPGVMTLVAVAGGEVAGFAQTLTDGEIQAYLCALAVAAPWRRRGVGSLLVEAALERSGAGRLDLLAHAGSDLFYDSFRHRSFSGYRLYPAAGEGR